MTEINELSYFRIVFPYFKSNSHADILLCPGILQLQDDLGAEILSFAICRAVLLFTAQIAQHASSVFGVVRRFI